MPSKRPYCITIAGFDPSGGAGIVADCKTFERLHVHGLSVLTANTIQTEDQYFSTTWMPQETILQQLIVLLERYPVKHFKIGLVENAAVLMTIIDTIYAHVPEPFILWDPILSPTAGGNLSEERFTAAFQDLFSKVQLITPNVPEYRQLFGTADPAGLASKQHLIYLKGGHAEERGKDFLYTGTHVHPFNPHVTTSHTKHGTGCILSAALLAHIALDFPLVKACLKSKKYLERALTSNDSLLAYHG